MAETTPFQERVYAKLRQVARSKVTTYGDLAKACRTSARAIGQAMRCNPYAPRVPCHRVVASDGSIGGFGGQTGGRKIHDKERLLAQEGIRIRNDRILDFDRVRHRW